MTETVELHSAVTATDLSKNFDPDTMKLTKQVNCLMEAMRLDPPIPMLNYHQTIADVKFTKSKTGMVIPKGTRFSVNISALHRDAAQYHFPDEFRPERFSKKSEIYKTPVKNELRHPFSWCPHITGLRESSGKALGFSIA